MSEDHAHSFVLPQFRDPSGEPAVRRQLPALLHERLLTVPLYVGHAYLHIPFCFHKCHYCDFYSIVDNLDRENPFACRMIEEIEVVATNNLRSIETLFVGGGTPTLLGMDSWQRLGHALRDGMPPADDHEWTIEANPETVTTDLAGVLVDIGFNRASVGAQSFDPRHLRTLERWHEPANVARAVDALRSAGFASINLDLIFGIPGQTLDDWRRDLETALAIGPDHLSCYGLTYEPATAMTARMQRGDFDPIDEEIEAAMYEFTLDRLADAGFEHYEISNWAKPGAACRHNLAYWRNDDWLALGPSASGHLRGLRWRNVPRLATYLDVGPWPLIIDAEVVDETMRTGERLMLGLRLRAGIPRTDLESWFAIDPAGDRRRRTLERALEDDRLEWFENALRLTRRGLLVADGVIAELL